MVKDTLACRQEQPMINPPTFHLIDYLFYLLRYSHPQSMETLASGVISDH